MPRKKKNDGGSLLISFIVVIFILVIQYISVILPIVIVVVGIFIFVKIIKGVRIHKFNKLKTESEEKIRNLHNRYEELMNLIAEEQDIEKVKLEIDEFREVIGQLSEEAGILKNYYAQPEEDEDDIQYQIKNDCLDGINSLHENILSEIIKDGTITDIEKQKLTYYELTMNIPKETITINRNNAYLIAFNWATEDCELTESEENVLKNIYFQLGIDYDDVQEQQEFLQELSIARQITNKELPAVSVPFALEEDESCHFISETSNFYKSRQENYFYYPLDYAEYTGRLYITNKRIIICTPDVFCYRIENISEIKNCNGSFIYIKDYKKVKPFFIEVPQPYIVKVVISNYLN